MLRIFFVIAIADCTKNIVVAELTRSELHRNNTNIVDKSIRIIYKYINMILVKLATAISLYIQAHFWILTFYTWLTNFFF